ncbi:MAG: GNAT family N-acetyltransferase [Smithella sp.]
MDYSKEISSSSINGNPHVSEGGELSLSNKGQMALLLATVEKEASLRTMARGFSMRPFIRDKDILTIGPVKDKKNFLGDVVAFTHPENGRMAIHRIIGHTDKGWLIRGDNCLEPDGVVPEDKIIGRVSRVERGEKDVRLGIGKAGALIAILNRGNALSSCKRIIAWPLLAAGKALQKMQSLRLYRWCMKRLAIQVEISEASEDDMEAVHTMFNPGVPYRMQESNPNVTNWVAKKNRQVIAFTQNIYHLQENQPWLGHWLFSLHVRARNRGAGIGERLTAKVIEKAIEQKATEILLVVFEDNKRAIRLYQKFGFEHTTLPALEPMLAEEKTRMGRRRIVMRKKFRKADERNY